MTIVYFCLKYLTFELLFESNNIYDILRNLSKGSPNKLFNSVYIHQYLIQNLARFLAT